jgi:hypothetical protein
MHRLAIEADDPLANAQRGGWKALLLGLLGPRGTLAAAVAASVLGLSIVVVVGLPQRARSWVHDRPDYSWTIERIELDPPPPGWIRSGLLSSASTPLRSYDRGSILDLDLGAVERAFKNLTWVERVRLVRRDYPDRLFVSLDYRRPVAIAPVTSTETKDDGEREYVLVDRHGLILERLAIDSEIGRAYAEELVHWSGLVDPTSVSAGHSWPSPDNPERPDPVALAAAELSAFLLDEAGRDGWPEDRSGRRIPFRKVHPLSEDPGKFFISHKRPDGEVLWVVWGSPPGSEGQDEPSASKKWAMLRDWVIGGGIDRPREPGALGFTDQGPEWLPAL